MGPASQNPLLRIPGPQANGALTVSCFLPGTPTHNQLWLLSLQSLCHTSWGCRVAPFQCWRDGDGVWVSTGRFRVSSPEGTECHYPATTPNVPWATWGSPTKWCRHIRPRETRSLFMNQVPTMYCTWCPHSPTSAVPIDRCVNRRRGSNKLPMVRARAGILDHAVMRGIGLNSCARPTGSWAREELSKQPLKAKPP